MICYLGWWEGATVGDELLWQGRRGVRGFVIADEGEDEDEDESAEMIETLLFKARSPSTATVRRAKGMTMNSMNQMKRGGLLIDEEGTRDR